MKFIFVTAFPGMIEASVSESMFRKAAEKGKVEYQIWNLRDFTRDRHRQIDDTPYGGGPGMILKPEPFFRAHDRLVKMTEAEQARIIYPTPQGELLDHPLTLELAREERLVFFCGHYKGIDQRVRDALVTDEISIGDYVLTGGELPALVIADAVVRHIPGVLHRYESAKTDSFADNLLEGPLYTNPREYRGWEVPDILLTGNHVKIEEWRQNQRMKRTQDRRKDLMKKSNRDREHGGKNG